MAEFGHQPVPERTCGTFRAALVLRRAGEDLGDPDVHASPARIDVETFREIIRFWQEGLSQRRIARGTGPSRADGAVLHRRDRGGHPARGPKGGD